MKLEARAKRPNVRPEQDWVSRPRRIVAWTYTDDARHLRRAPVLLVHRANSIEQRFEDLHFEWTRTRNPYSSGAEQFMLPAYQQIIGLGPDAVPLILRCLEHELDEWFWALAAITGDNPVPPEHAGYYEAMRDDWLGWARENGILW